MRTCVHLSVCILICVVTHGIYMYTHTRFQLNTPPPPPNYKHTVQFMAAELPHCSVHNLHHNAPPTAEMALGLLLAAAKRILPADRWVYVCVV